jgi:benzoate membrane transport protein
VLPVLAVWLILYRFAPIWASPVAVTLAFVLIALTMKIEAIDLNLLPTLELVAPNFNLAGLFSIALPLYFVTMAGQNIPGIAIMKTFGFEVPFRPTLVATGAVTAAGSFFGGDFSNAQTGLTAQIVPAPGALALLGLGGLVAGRRSRR